MIISVDSHKYDVVGRILIPGEIATLYFPLPSDSEGPRNRTLKFEGEEGSYFLPLDPFSRAFGQALPLTTQRT